MSHELPLPETSYTVPAHAVSDEHVPWTVTMLAFVLNVSMMLYRLDQGLAELNPVILALIPAFGSVDALILLKLVVFAVAVAARHVLLSRCRGAIPIGVTIPWDVAELVNTRLILVTVFG